MLKTSDFDYDLDPGLIAQHPLPKRDASRLMVLHRATGAVEHRRFRDLGQYLRPGDILVANDTRVLPCRLLGKKARTGGKVELLLLEEREPELWLAMVGGKRLEAGTVIEITRASGSGSGLTGEVVASADGALRLVRFDRPVAPLLPEIGQTPLPPYIHETLAEPERYQTVYGRHEGSAAASTAGLHFTPELLLEWRRQGVLFETVTLHIGLDTFKPVEAANPARHTIHREWARLTPESARRINEARLAGGRIIAVGTTSARVLETAALRSAGVSGPLDQMSARDASGETAEMCPWRPVAAFEGYTDLFIYPAYRFRAVEAMITNFHLPQSSLIMMVSAFASRELILAAYQEAQQEGYRFYSFGDAMLIL
jgi:S-adenosylmethionine:tRNA ribosyltransferase-isomerase